MRKDKSGKKNQDQFDNSIRTQRDFRSFGQCWIDFLDRFDWTNNKVNLVRHLENVSGFNEDKVFEQDSGKQAVIENSPAKDKAT
jgi:hypothetical protein